MTRKMDQQIDDFNAEFKRNHPQYQGLRNNCQLFAREFVDFLMEEGERKRNLPAQESPLAADTFWAGLAAAVLVPVLGPEGLLLGPVLVPFLGIVMVPVLRVVFSYVVDMLF
jgi:hypothetical protein